MTFREPPCSGRFLRAADRISCRLRPHWIRWTDRPPGRFTDDPGAAVVRGIRTADRAERHADRHVAVHDHGGSGSSRRKEGRQTIEKLSKKQKRALNMAHARAQRVLSETTKPDADTLEELQAQLDAALSTVFDSQDMARIQAATLRLTELPMRPNDTSSWSLGKVDPCTDRCTENFTVDVVATEIMYMSALVGCAYTGPIAPACWGVATVSRAAELISTTVSYTNCLEACREAGGS